MADRLSVLWTVFPTLAPRPWLSCSRCGKPRSHVSSGKFRINANGRRLDAWLFYRCADCERTWNRPLFERRPLASLEPGLREALTLNDPGLARRFAFDLVDLKRRCDHVESFDAVEIRKRRLAGSATRPAALDILLVAERPTRVRLERLLAEGLGLTRSRVRRLHDADRLSVMPLSSPALRRPLTGHLSVELGLAGFADAETICRAASGG
ncbi:MAG: DUF1062 domain-containing protein [Tistlia sp.]|uniref:DUF1062 domain-containing protein n=1 Tax=Tistlia sp. TaxID=3057121 RepID=UPI0034A49556